jgi:hypothetical protein
VTHLTRDELVRWHETGSAQDRDRIVGHLAACDDCGRLYGEVLQTSPVAVPVPLADAARELAPLGHRAVSGRRAFWSPGRLVAAAAAVVLLGVLASPMVSRWTTGEDSDRGVRGTTLQVTSPVGPVVPPLEFQWASPFAASRYRVEVLDASGQVVALATVAAERATWSDFAAPTPAPGAYTWRVTALDGSGATIAVSNTGAFVVGR